MRQGLTMRAAATAILMAFFFMSDVQAADGLVTLPQPVYTGFNPLDVKNKVSKLQNIPERQAFAGVILEEQGWTMYDLKQMVQDSLSEGDRSRTAKVAIILLGKLRAVEAVPLLVENLTFEALYDDMTGFVYNNHEHTMPVTRIPTIEDDYPCVGALIGIGSPAIEPLMKKAEENDDDIFMRLTATILEKILDPRTAVAYLNDRLEQQNESIRRERLTRLLKYIQDEPGRREKLIQSLKPLELKH